jgi:hypothetical protein
MKIERDNAGKTRIAKGDKTGLGGQYAPDPNKLVQAKKSLTEIHDLITTEPAGRIKKWNSKGEEMFFDDSVYYENQNEIEALLVGRTIKKVDNELLILDDGTVLHVEGNEGCGGCDAGVFSITELNECENVITAVEFEQDDEDNDNWYEDKSTFRLFVYSENQKIKLFEIEGDNGNGYYGTGYYINVRRP